MRQNFPPINPLMKQSQYVPVSSRFPYIFLSVLRRRDSVDPGGEKRIDWPSSEQLFDHVADVFVLWVEHQIHQIYYYTRSYQYKNLEQICTFAIILCNKERFEDVVLWSRSKVIAVPRALQNMIAWQSSTAAFTVDISKHLQINQITTPEIFHLDFQQERECLMRLTCVGLPKWTFYVYAARCRQMPPGAPWKTAAPGRSSRRLGGCCSCASGTSAITGTSALWHSGSWLLIDSAVQLGRFRRNLWDFDCLRIIGWNMQRTSEDMP